MFKKKTHAHPGAQVSDAQISTYKRTHLGIHAHTHTHTHTRTSAITYMDMHGIHI